jgi:Domain of Unknown Function (DUF928)
MKAIHKLFSSIVLSTIAILGSSNFPVWSQTADLENSQLTWEFVPPNDGAPDDRQDGSSRSNCPESDKPFQVLAPATNLGLTIAEFPTFWLYVPYSNSSAHAVEFILRDEATKSEVYRTKFLITQGQGIVGFQLPADATPLNLGQKYRWRFNLFCNGEASDIVSDNGVILRTSLETELPEAIADKMEVYSQNGIWYDFLTELVKLRCVYPEDEEIFAEWTALLQHPVVRLGNLVSEPILEECSAVL